MSRITEEILRIVKKLHMTHDDLILETELVESEESYLHLQLMGYGAEDLRLAAKFYYAFMWQDIVRIYINTMDLTPQITVDEILKQYSLEDTIYTFAVRLREISWQRTTKSNNYHFCSSRVNVADIWRERASTLSVEISQRFH